MNYDILTATDKEVLKASGYGARRGFGKRPALMIIDAQNKFIGPDKPILEAAKVYPTCIGERANKSVKHIKTLLEMAREKGIPVFYSTSYVPVDEMPFNSFAKKRVVHEKNVAIPADQNEIVEELKPIKGKEWVVHKHYASGLFGTPLISFFNTFNVDTIIVTGFVTSGCVRAFSVDAASYNFNVVIPEECVADRFESLHNAALLDLNFKYADVIPVTEVEEYLKNYKSQF